MDLEHAFAVLNTQDVDLGQAHQDLAHALGIPHDRWT